MQMQLHHLSNTESQTDRAEHWTSGAFHARQWVGAGQGSAGEPTTHVEHWTGGEWVGEGQGDGPRTDTGAFHARQWVGARLS